MKALDKLRELIAEENVCSEYNDLTTELFKQEKFDMIQKDQKQASPPIREPLVIPQEFKQRKLHKAWYELANILYAYGCWRSTGWCCGWRSASP